MVRTLMVIALLMVAASTACAAGDNAVKPVEIHTTPTLTCVGIEWHIEGDTNENARVTVAYRKQGDESWRQAMNLMRVENIAHDGRGLDDPVIDEPTRGRRYWTFDPPIAYGNLLAGSIFYLDPDTSYEVRLHLQDPDGGEAEQTVNVRTRAIPNAPANSRTLHMRPGAMNGDGSKSKPFGDAQQVQQVVRPGDTVLLHEGTYGKITLTADGEPGLPITWRGVDRAKVFVTGDDAINCADRNHIIIENLSIETKGIGVRGEHANHLTVRGCRIEAGRIGVYIEAGKNGLVADNIITGPVKWTDPKGPVMKAEGITTFGSGHVICRNLVTNTCDGINADTGQLATNNIDIYHNDIWVCTDDGIEIDHAGRNIRVFENRLTNVYSSMSNQPLFGGPCYWIRNVSYACNGGFKFHCNPSGIIALHNTIVAHGFAWKNMAARHVFLRNNLFAGGWINGNQDWNCLHSLHGIKLNWDHDAVLRNASARLIELFAPARNAPVGKVHYANMTELFEDTGLEEHGIEITWADFTSIKSRPTGDAVVRPDAWSVMLAPHSAAVDGGEVLPNISDSFEGQAPDIGAWETGRPMPHYGPDPRVQAVDFDQLPASDEIQN